MRRAHLLLAAGAAAACLTLALPLAAQDAGNPPDPAEIAERTRQIRENPLDYVDQETYDKVQEVAKTAPETYKGEIDQITAQNPAIFQKGLELAQEMAGSHMDAARENGQMGAPGGKEDIRPRYRIFISQSMPKAEVKRLVEAFRGREDVALVLRGLLPGQKLAQLQQWVGKMLAPIKADSKVPLIIIDPEPYTALGTDQVPVIARYDDQGALATYAFGSTSVEFIEDAFSKGRTGNIGSIGPTQRVGEEDMIAAMQRKAAAFDWNAAKMGAVTRYFQRTEAYELPRVDTPRTRELDPTFEVSKTITAPDGQVIARQGERINPLQMMPFNDVLLFIDPADAAQMAWAKAQVKANAGRRNVVLMATQVKTLGSLEGVGKASDALGTRMFLLPKAVKDKFDIQRVPSLVWSQNARFYIEEQRPDARPKVQ